MAGNMFMLVTYGKNYSANSLDDKVIEKIFKKWPVIDRGH
jgi:hypothetical protein